MQPQLRRRLSSCVAFMVLSVADMICLTHNIYDSLDRLATFEPQLVAKHQRRLPGFDDHVISMYARGTRAGFRAACSELRAHKGLQA
jgi:hypothetical protein